MDLSGAQHLITGQGPLFWGAAAAAALGASLLTAALVMQFGRLRPRLRLRPVGLHRRRAKAPVTAPAVARAVPGGYAPAGATGPATAWAPIVATGAAEGAPVDFGPALARLRRASERLAGLREPAADSQRPLSIAPVNCG